MKTIEQLEHELKEIQQQIEKLKKVDDFDVEGKYFVDGAFFVKKAYYPTLNFKDISIFNIFETREQAEKIGKKFNAYLKLWHIAQHLNEGWEPDWKNEDELKYSLIYDNNLNKIRTGGYFSLKHFDIYFKNENLTEKAIEMMGEESLKDYFL